MDHLVNKADLTPSPFQAAAKELMREKRTTLFAFVFSALTEQASAIVLYARRNQGSPRKVSEFERRHKDLTEQAGYQTGNGAERNRTAVRANGVNHLSPIFIDRLVDRAGLRGAPSVFLPSLLIADIAPWFYTNPISHRLISSQSTSDPLLAQSS